MITDVLAVVGHMISGIRMSKGIDGCPLKPQWLIPGWVPLKGLTTAVEDSTYLEPY